MENKPIFYNDQNVLVEDLDQITTYNKTEMVTRFKSLMTSPGGFGNNSVSGSNLTGGILGNPVNYWNTAIDLKVSFLSTTSIQIGAGKAIDNDGNLIVVDTPQTVTVDVTTTTSEWERNSGLLYVYISYQEIQGSNKPDLTGGLHATRVTPSYYILVTTSPELYATGYIPLATFNAQSSGEALISTLVDKRVYASVVVPASSVVINPDPATKTAPSTHTTVQNHIDSIGHSTPTQSNPHGMTMADLGFDENAVLANFVSHSNYAHRNGIILTMIAGFGNVNSFLGVTNSPANDRVTFTPATGAVAFINSKTVTTFTPSYLLGADAYNLGGDTTYYAVMNSSGSISWKLASAQPAGYLETYNRISKNYPDELLLGQAVVSDSGADIAWTDLRSWYTLNAEDISPDDTTSMSSPYTGDPRKSLADHLAELRYQIGGALKGPGIPWNDGDYPLTAGLNADAYHSHLFDAMPDVVVYPAMRVANLATLLNGPTSNADDFHTHAALQKSAVNFIPELAWGQNAIQYTRKKVDDDLGLTNISDRITFGNNRLYIASVGAGKIYKVDPFKSITANVQVSLTASAVGSVFYDGSYVFVSTFTPAKILKLNKDTLVQETSGSITLSTGAGAFVTDGSAQIWAIGGTDLYKINYSTMALQSTTALSPTALSNLLYDGSLLWGTTIGGTTANVFYIYNLSTTPTKGFVTLSGNVVSNPVFDGTYIWVMFKGSSAATNSIARINTTAPYAVTEWADVVNTGSGIDYDKLYFDGKTLWMASTTGVYIACMDLKYKTAAYSSTGGTTTNGVNSITFDGVHVWFALSAEALLHRELSV